MASLTDKLPRPARTFLEPLRPSDAKWRSRNGELRDDYGPYFEIIDLKYSSGAPAIQRQEDGSGFASYPSGRKAVCASTHHKSRRVSAIVFGDGNFQEQRSPPQTGARMPKTSTAILGTFDDWGMGKVECPLTPQTSIRGAYEIFMSRGQKFVSVTNPSNGVITSVEMSNRKKLEESQLALRLRLNNFLTVRFDPERGVTAIDFSAEGVSHTFHLGEVYACRSKNELKTTTPSGINTKINLTTQSDVDTVRNTMTSGVDTLLDTLQCRAAAEPVKRAAYTSGSASAPLLDVTIAKDLLKERLDFTFEHKLKEECRKKNPPMQRHTVKAWSGKSTDSCHFDQPLKIPLDAGGDAPAWDKPVLVPQVSTTELEQMIESTASSRVLICGVVLASWATKSSNSSSGHAQQLARAAAAELARRAEVSGSASSIRIVLLEMSEAGGIHSTGRFVNPLVTKYGVQTVPWLLLFGRGKCVYSERPGNEHGGLGFVSRLRYQTLAKPHFLVFNPVHSKEQEGSQNRIMAYNHQLETQNTLQRCHFLYEVALSAQDAQRMISNAEPPYGAVIANTSAGATETAMAFRLAQKRNTQVLNFLVHCWKSQGEPTEEIRRLAADKVQVTSVFTRPLTKSQLEKELGKHPVASLNYAEAGMSKESFLALLDEKHKSMV